MDRTEKSLKRIVIGLIILAVVVVILGVIYNAEEERFQEETDRFISKAETEQRVRAAKLGSRLPERAKKWTYINEPDQMNSLYEGVHCITDETSIQYAWLQSHEWSFDEDGIGMYDGRVMVALTPVYGSVGDYVDLLLEDGRILQVVIVDVKANAETYGHRHGENLNVIEILVSEKWYDEYFENKWYPDVVGYR